MTEQAGIIKTITDRGFGFIKPDAGGQDVFFHARDDPDYQFAAFSLNERVKFIATSGDKGPRAIEVREA